MAGGSKENASTNSEATVFALIVVVVGGIVLMWFFWKEPIVLASYYIDRLQVVLYDRIFGLGEVGQRYLDYLDSFFVGRQLAGRVTPEEFAQVEERIGTVMRLPITIMIALMGALIYFFMKGRGFTNRMNLVPFINYQAEHWGTLTPSARFQPDRKEKQTLPAKRPVDWMHDLGIKARLTPAGVLPDASRAACEKAFIKQLGRGWAPLPRLKTHERVLFAMFALHGIKAKNALEFRETVARLYADSTDAKKRDAALEELVKPALADESRIKPYIEMAEKHAYVSTALISILRDVRKARGVLASAEMVWLKKIDRNLWYAINDTGRNAFHIESAGVFSHYFYENVSKRAHQEPKVDSAIQGLEDYLTHHGIEELED